MADPFQHVAAGEPLEVPAAAWNAMLDAGKLAKRSALGSDRSTMPGGGDWFGAATLVLFRSTSTRAAFSILGYSTDQIVDPPTYPHEVRRKPGIDNAAAPTNANAPFVVTIEPIEADGIGRAVSSGVIVCKVNVADADHARAVPVVGETAYLASIGRGGVPILWKETGTGVKWAVILLVDPVEDYPYLARTESTGVANVTRIFKRTHNATGGPATWQDVGASFTSNNFNYGVCEVDQTPFYIKPVTGGSSALVFADPNGGLQLLPIQYADKENGGYYPGYLSHGAQRIAGAKYWENTHTFQTGLLSLSIARVDNLKSVNGVRGDTVIATTRFSIGTMDDDGTQHITAAGASGTDPVGNVFTGGILTTRSTAIYLMDPGDGVAGGTYS